MYHLVNRQIKAILKSDDLYTKDVFIPKKVMPKPVYDDTFDNMAEFRMSSALLSRLKEMGRFRAKMKGESKVKTTLKNLKKKKKLRSGSGIPKGGENDLSWRLG